MTQSMVMVVEDEPHIAEVIRLYLEHAGFGLAIYHRGEGVINGLQRHEPDLVLLDVMLPDVGGFELCGQIRALEAPAGLTPIIMLTAKDQSMDKLRGFNLGADDYIVKPFEPNELVARIKAVLRRAGQRKALHQPSEKTGQRRSSLAIAGLHLDLEQYKVTVNGAKVELTPKEIELLRELAGSPGKVFSREDLLARVWNFDFAGGTRTVDAHVKNLRKKLGSHPEWSIQTLWGIGYSFEVNRHD